MPPIRRHLLTILLLTLLAATPAQAQTVKALSFNTTNGVVLGPTNTNLSFSAPVQFDEIRLNSIRSSYWKIGAVNQLYEDGGDVFAAVGTNEVPNHTWGISGFNFHVAPTFDLPAQTRTNLGLGGGITTNIAVLVAGGGTNTLQFSNGVLTNVTTP